MIITNQGTGGNPLQGIPEIPGITRSDIGVMTYNVELQREKDQENPAREERAKRVGADMEYLLKQSFSACPTDEKKAKAVIQLSIHIASEGSRTARIWAAELGRGHAKLFVSWSLIDLQNQTVLKSNYIQDRSSAGCGAADLCQANAGDFALNKMADSFASRISSDITMFLARNQFTNA